MCLIEVLVPVQLLVIVQLSERRAVVLDALTYKRLQLSSHCAQLELLAEEELIEERLQVLDGNHARLSGDDTNVRHEREREEYEEDRLGSQAREEQQQEGIRQPQRRQRNDGELDCLREHHIFRLDLHLGARKRFDLRLGCVPSRCNADRQVEQQVGDR